MFRFNAHLVRVVDGDTIDADIELGFSVFMRDRIRLMGIDTPESRTRNLQEKSWGMAAKHRLIELLAETDGEFTLVTEDMEKGKFGRVLGTIEINGKDANQTLIEENFAIPYEGGNKDESRTKYGVMELWNTDYENPQEHEDDHEHGDENPDAHIDFHEK
jgi:micrococcal nuclease|tara:strand:- start:24439 stop:24918 length:480 start_codon:yes stop_codon:yes gene_type:complete